MVSTLKILFCIIAFPVPSLMKAQSIKDTNKTRSTFYTRQYPRKVLGKMQQYQVRIMGKTEKTLKKLIKWENKIRTVLKKADPQMEERLFGNEKKTFTSLLDQLREGEANIKDFQVQYDAYLDTLASSLNYLHEDSLHIETDGGIDRACNQIPLLRNILGQANYTAQYIKERKTLLIREAGKYLKQSLITRISKEDYYFGEALANYKEIFSDKTRTEQLVKQSLLKIPGFREFMEKHSMLSSMFRMPGSNVDMNSSINLVGLQTRASVQNMIQQRIIAGGPNAANQLRQNLSEAQSRLNEMKDKIMKGGVIGSGGEAEIPGFKPNQQKSKTLWQRLEYSFDVQFAKTNGYLPSTTDIAVSIGYRLNDKSVIGAGLSYKMGLGSIDHIRFSSEGIGLRSYLDWKIKGQWYASGGYEMNYRSAFKSIAELKDAAWQRSALMGVSRQYKAGRKLKGEVKLLYDFMAERHVPVESPFVFRVGYKF